jgi:predicted ATPase
LIHEKTTGNPFFAIQFISALSDEGLLTFDYGEGRWVWDLRRIHAKGFTDNVVELMVGKLNRLPVETQTALSSSPAWATVPSSTCCEWPSGLDRGDARAISGKPCAPGLIFRSDDSYRFLHDRVQEAAYSLIPKELRAEAHLRIGMLLAAHTSPAKREEGHLRDRQSTQSRLSPHHLGRRSRAGRGPESDRGQAREGLDRI